jgi:AraC family transcriptional regulator
LDSSPHPHQRYRDRFAPLVDHVRQNPTGDLSVEALARVVSLSPFHFHRLFGAVTGERVGTFVQRVRLERAVQLMKAVPGRSLTEVAAASGFGSLAALSRAFRRAYGVAPSRWNRRSPLVFRPEERPPPPGDDVPRLDEMLTADTGPAPQVELRQIQSLTLAYVRVRRPWESGALQAGYERLQAWMDRAGLERRELLGISWDDVEVTPPDQIRYDVAAGVPPDTDGGPGVALRTWPAFVAAAAPARGTLARVARVWDHLYHEWLPSSRLEPRDLPAFEWHRDWPHTLASDRWDLDCCVPVRAPK